MFLIFFDNLCLDVLIKGVLIKKKKCNSGLGESLCDGWNYHPAYKGGEENIYKTRPGSNVFSLEKL